jgi:5-methylcytosine-specific restriction endonuclease McrA
MNPPNHEGYYICGICGGWVEQNEMQIDHILPRGGTSYNLRNNLDNLQPSHPICNSKKGSKRL